MQLRSFRKTESYFGIRTVLSVRYRSIICQGIVTTVLSIIPITEDPRDALLVRMDKGRVRLHGTFPGSRAVLEEMAALTSEGPSETGGILGCTQSGQYVFCPDKKPDMSAHNEYRPNVLYLNYILAEWAEKGIRFCGFVHTHPDLRYSKLSRTDRRTASLIMETFSIEQLWMLVVICEKQEIHIFSYLEER